MRPQPPDSLELDGETISVAFRASLGWIDKRYRTGGMAYKGRVVLREGLTLGAEQAVLWHELLHEALRRAGASFPEATEERFLDALDGWSLQILRENPDLVRYLMA